MNKNTLRASALVLAAATMLAGCQTEQGTNTAVGTGVGAAVGAGLGNLIGGNTTGTLIGAAVGAAAGGATGYNWGAIKNMLGGHTAGTGTTISEQPDGTLKVAVPSDVTFDTGRAEIKPNFRAVLDDVAASLNQNPGITANVVGHTDSTGGDRINIPLSQNRAANVIQYLNSRGVAMNRMSGTGVASSQPVASNATAEGRAQNRRVEILLSAPRG
ncbi:membrane protein [Pandoraea horticolens]|uniref:Membrane protein n=1 Tax=Pandoraea horticolens TaxID=2508298 RepID=A0A5E4VUK8_9BURK|nr:OmpA family protein [Pandoraea horticolens]VVE15249.1 membrane protein [Pandoraea horticolens]